MKVRRMLLLKEVAQTRDRLIRKLEREKKSPVNPDGLDMDEQEVYEDVLNWVIEEIQEAFDFDGEEGEFDQ